jgi:hypothetical protein
MKTSIVSLALGVILVSPVAAYATHHAMRDPFKPRITNGLSGNRDACASYGCVGAGGGGD